MAEIDQTLLAEIATTPFAENASPATLTLELTLPPAEAARLPRLRALAPLKTGRVRTAAVRIIWHDTANIYAPPRARRSGRPAPRRRHLPKPRRATRSTTRFRTG